MGIGASETWNPSFCSMGQSHWNIFWTSRRCGPQSVDWDAEADWVLDDQWTATPKIKTMMQDTDRLLLGQGIIHHLKKQRGHWISSGSGIILGKPLGECHGL